MHVEGKKEGKLDIFLPQLADDIIMLVYVQPIDAIMWYLMHNGFTPRRNHTGFATTLSMFEDYFLLILNKYINGGSFAKFRVNHLCI